MILNFYFLSWSIIQVWKKIETVRKHRDIRLVTTERRRRSCLVSQPNYHPTKSFAENLLETEM